MYLARGPHKREKRYALCSWLGLQLLREAVAPGVAGVLNRTEKDREDGNMWERTINIASFKRYSLSRRLVAKTTLPQKRQSFPSLAWHLHCSADAGARGKGGSQSLRTPNSLPSTLDALSHYECLCHR